MGGGLGASQEERIVPPWLLPDLWCSGKLGKDQDEARGRCWSWNSNTLATWCEELTHSKRPWCWERLKVGGDGDNRRWDGWMASPTQWTCVWVNSGSWWWTGRPGVLQYTGSQRVEHDRATTQNLTYAFYKYSIVNSKDHLIIWRILLLFIAI